MNMNVAKTSGTLLLRKYNIAAAIPKHGPNYRSQINSLVNETTRSKSTSALRNVSHNSPSASGTAVQFQSIKAFGVGSLAGVLGSLAGMGGGFVMIPLMTSNLLRLSQHTAHGTSLFAVATTGVAGALGYGLAEVDLESAAAVAVCGMVTARLGAASTSKLSGKTLKTLLGVFMIGVAPIVPAKSYIAKRYGGVDEGENRNTTEKSVEAMESKEKTTFQRLFPPGMIGLGSGFLAGLFGVGGGAVVVPALTVTTDMTHYQALGTSLCAMTLPAMVGTATHFQKGNVALRVAFPLAFGSFAGAFAGGRFGLNVPEDKLRWGFSALMLTLGMRTLLRR